jgi:hypothetical protein
MPILAALALILLIVVIAAIRALVHLAEAHAAMAAGSALIGIPAVIGIAWAVMRGTMKHVILSVPEKERRPQLPAPAAPRAIEAAPAAVADPFSSGITAWEQMVEAADREDLMRAGPRESRPRRRCEAPGCGIVIEGEAWVVDVEEGGREEEHSFCSGECADAWQRADQEAR